MDLAAWDVRRARVFGRCETSDVMSSEPYRWIGRSRRCPSKAFFELCAENLPLYMVPDAFSFQETLPRSSMAKVDYQRLKEMD